MVKEFEQEVSYDQFIQLVNFAHQAVAIYEESLNLNGRNNNCKQRGYKGNLFISQETEELPKEIPIEHWLMAFLLSFKRIGGFA